tara:strand:+ start:15828 stop:15932 length:105 start_codon:yes stop_codon:yes gene_type:complete
MLQPILQVWHSKLELLEINPLYLQQKKGSAAVFP